MPNLGNCWEINKASAIFPIAFGAVHSGIPWHAPTYVKLRLIKFIRRHPVQDFL